MKLSLLLSAVVIWSGLANASVITLTNGKTEKQGVLISTGGIATLEGQAYPLTTVGSGVRFKKVFFDVKVYVAQLLMAEESKFVRTLDGALGSLSQQNSFAMHLTFLREVPMDKLTSAFEEGFAANKVNMRDADIMNFMNMVRLGGAGEDGGTLSVIVIRNADGSETITYEVVRSHKPFLASIKAQAGLAGKIFSLWLGVPADDHLAKLKLELLL